MAALAQGIAQAELREKNKEVPRVPVRRGNSLNCCYLLEIFLQNPMDNVAARDGAALGSSQRGCRGVPGFSLCKAPQPSHSWVRAVLGCSPAAQSQGCPLEMSWHSWSPPIALSFPSSPVSGLTCPQTEILWSSPIIFLVHGTWLGFTSDMSCAFGISSIMR